jgi:hypothetical protein
VPVNDTDARASLTTALRSLGVAIFAGVAVTVGALMRWLIHLDEPYDPANAYFANFLIGAGSLVALGALLVVAKSLVSFPKTPTSSPDLARGWTPRHRGTRAP